jgi:hypothetical protein
LSNALRLRVITVVVPVVGLLIWVVKAIVEKLATGQDKLVEGQASTNRTLERVAVAVEKMGDRLDAVARSPHHAERQG